MAAGRLCTMLSEHARLLQGALLHVLAQTLLSITSSMWQQTKDEPLPAAGGERLGGPPGKKGAQEEAGGAHQGPHPRRPDGARHVFQKPTCHSPTSVERSAQSNASKPAFAPPRWCEASLSGSTPACLLPKRRRVPNCVALRQLCAVLRYCD